MGGTSIKFIHATRSITLPFISPSCNGQRKDAEKSIVELDDFAVLPVGQVVRCLIDTAYLIHVWGLGTRMRLIKQIIIEVTVAGIKSRQKFL